MRLLSYYAYLDAGTGSVIVQSLIGIAAGVGVFGRKVISGAGHKVRNLFSRSEESTKTSKSGE